LGAVNLGVEGIILFGAFTAYMVTIATGDPLAGLGSAIAMGTLVTAVLEYTAVILGVIQAVAGLGIWLLGLGLTGVIYYSSSYRCHSIYYQKPARCGHPYKLCRI